MSRKVAVNKRRQSVEKIKFGTSGCGENIKCKSYTEMKLKDFLKFAPRFLKVLPDNLDVDDENYVVRIDKDFDCIEVGYLEDEWFLKG